MDGAAIVKEKIDIVQYIGNSVKLKKAGASFSGLCPFHREDTPSFHVSPDRQAWHCFGCQRGGDLISFVMEKEGVDFSTALELLAREAGIPIEKIKMKSEKPQNDRSFELLEHARLYYQQNLHSPNGKSALSYLTDQRKLSSEQIALFQIGYAKDAWDDLGKHLLGKGYSVQEMEQLGLVIQKSGKDNNRGWYDRFRHRVMFPIHDHIGRIVGFSGRTLSKDPHDAKYINSPESAVFQKGQILFGLPFTREHIHKDKKAVLVEGQLDVISLYGIGVKNAVAPQGTGFTMEQLKRLRRYTDQIIIYFDQDLAGTKAAVKSVKKCLETDGEVKVATVSVGKDPDEAANTDPESVRQDIAKAVSFYDYLMELLNKKKVRHNSSLVIQKMLPIINLVNSSVTKEGYLQRLADDTGVSLGSIQKTAGSINSSSRYNTRSDSGESPTSPVASDRHLDRETLLWRELLAIFIQDPSMLSGNGQIASWLREITFEDLVKEDLENNDLDNKELIHCLAKKLIDYFLEKQAFLAEEFELQLDEDEKKLVDLLSMHNLGTISSDSDQMYRSVDRLIKQLVAIQLRREIKMLVGKNEHDPEHAEKVRALTIKLKQTLA